MSPDTSPATADDGLLSPVWVGTAAEALTSDRAVLTAMTAVEAALSAALTTVGLTPAGPTPTVDLDPRRLAREAVAPGNPTVPLVDALRAPLDAERASAVHHGATSQDVLDSALMVVSTAVLDRLERDLGVVAEHLAALAARWRDTPCVARTLTQQAMPTTLGFRAAGWLAGVHDALLLVRGCRPLPVSLGGPVGTAAAYGAHGPAVVATLADTLALSAPVISWHTRRTPLLGLGSALAAVGQACGRVCADVLLMAQTEVGEASEGSGGRSSAMAHKSNPTRSVLVVSAARQLPGLLGTLTACGAGASERPAGDWHAEWQPLRTMLRLAGASAERTTALAADLVVDPGALTRNLDLLVSAVGEGPRWVEEQTAHVGTWVDRVLAQHQEICP